MLTRGRPRQPGPVTLLQRNHEPYTLFGHPVFPEFQELLLIICCIPRPIFAGKIILCSRISSEQSIETFEHPTISRTNLHRLQRLTLRINFYDIWGVWTPEEKIKPETNSSPTPLGSDDDSTPVPLKYILGAAYVFSAIPRCVNELGDQIIRTGWRTWEERRAFCRRLNVLCAQPISKSPRWEIMYAKVVDVRCSEIVESRY